MEIFGLHRTKTRMAVRVTPATPSGPGEPVTVISAALYAALVVTVRLPDLPDDTLPSQWGMRVALAFTGARLKGRRQVRFADNVLAMPDEAVVYWFVGCFYGYRQKAFRAALSALLGSQDDPARRADRLTPS